MGRVFSLGYSQLLISLIAIASLVFLSIRFRQYKNSLKRLMVFCEFYFITKSKANGGNAISFVSQIILNVRCQPLDFTVTSIYFL
jgi:hypothetical protein